MGYIKRHLGLGLISGSVLAACGGPAPTVDYLPLCLSETGAKGAYVRSPQRVAENGLPLIVPAEGGDARGALLMNACIERRHTNMGTMPKAPPKPSASIMMANGKLSVPENYILSEEDKALWPTLTLEQQKRALLFLQSGSTVQSSLQED